LREGSNLSTLHIRNYIKNVRKAILTFSSHKHQFTSRKKKYEENSKNQDY